MKRVLLVLLCSVGLQGCVNLQAAKSLTLKPEPEERVLVVTANAASSCKHFFFFIRCTLDVDVVKAK